MQKFLITAEAVCEGHADKVADQIADAILDEIIKQDKRGRCACEVMAGNNFVVLGGEIDTLAWIDYDKLVRKIIRDIGYSDEQLGFNCKTVAILNAINRQSPDIARAVGKAGSKRQGAGDQGFCIGYATVETPEFMPLPAVLAQKTAMRLAEVRKKNIIGYLKPDGKCQLSLEYKNGRPHRLENVVICAQHEKNIENARIKKDIEEQVIKPLLQKYIDSKTRIFINNTGRFVVGGPASDTGMTGHKTAIDSYGGVVPMGGGGLSGKDPTKIDRAGAYMARYVAKNVVAAGLAGECFVRLAYVIGKVHPVEVSVETFGTENEDTALIEKAVLKVFDFSAGGMIRQLKLLRPIYRKTSCYGHFGRSEPEFSWEKKDKVEELLRVVAKLQTRK